MLLGIRQVLYLMRIGAQIVQLLCWFLRPKKQLLRLCHRLSIVRRQRIEMLLVHPAHLAHRGHLLHVVDVLGIRPVWKEVPNIFIAAVVHGAHPVVGLVHAIAMSKNILAWTRCSSTKKRLSLHMTWDGNACQTKNG